MKQVLFVFLGGGIGSVLRFLLSKSLNPASGIPLGTLTVNVVGSLLIGLFFGLGLRQNLLSSNAMLLLATGFCGGFTTFSAFTYENLALLRAGEFMNFTLYGFGSIVLGLLAVMIGIYSAKLF